MAGTVVVLTPNGRRQTVKVTPNTTLLQILEEACEKHGFKPELYNLKHHRKILDVTLTVRFAGLPNNCLLELIEAEIVRTEQIVTIGLQTEDGKRCLGEFSPVVSIYDVVAQLCPSELCDNTVVVYMRNEIYGNDLKSKNLKSLGITSGKAMLRLLRRSPEELKTQANVSVPIPTKPVEEKPYKRQYQPVNNVEIKSITPNVADTTLNKSSTELNSDVSKSISKKKPSEDSSESYANTEATLSPPPKYKRNDVVDLLRQEKRKQTEGLKIKNHCSAKKPAEIVKNESVVKDDFVFLGERNAMLFSFETAQALSCEELPDDFYELSIDDVKKLFKDIKHRRAQEEGAPLMTSAMRELEESKKQLRTLNHYKKAVIRVQFPNRMVLQGVFKPSETIQDVIEFVKEYIFEPKLNFYLFTTPPKIVLQCNLTLLQADCVPGALLHFGCEHKVDNYLRADILDKVQSTTSAAVVASQARLANKRIVHQESEEDMDISDDIEIDTFQDVAGASTKHQDTFEDYASASVSKTPSEKLPKWFKPSK